MKNKLVCFLSSTTVTIILLFVYATIMIIATFIDKQYGLDVAKKIIYHSPIFIVLQVFIVLNFWGVTFQKKFFLKKKWNFLLLHLSYVIILLGAMITHVFGEEGLLHIREKEITDTYIVKDSESLYTPHRLPFNIELLDFKLLRYPGSNSPSSYESIVCIHDEKCDIQKRIYMNNVLDYKGFRFFQASYDRDEKGSILVINKDVFGRNITYIGYFLLFIGILGCMFGKNSRFRNLVRRMNSLKSFLFCICFISNSLYSVNIPQGQAEKFGNLPMQDTKGRIVPINTFASEFVRKLHLDERLGDLSDDQFLLDIIVNPKGWLNVPLIRINDKSIRLQYNDGKEYISYKNIFSKRDGSYILGDAVEEAYLKNPAKRSHYDKELLKLDEKINLLNMLFNGQLLRIFPVYNDTVNFRWLSYPEVVQCDKDKSARKAAILFEKFKEEILEACKSNDWLRADRAIEAISIFQQKNVAGKKIDKKRLMFESFHNRYEILPWCQRIYLLGGFLMLIKVILTFKKQSSEWYVKFVSEFCVVAVFLAFLLHLFYIILRGYISGYVPWSNSYETLVFLSWISILVGGLFLRRSLMTFSLSVLLGGITLFVSSLNWMNPEITPLVPVLKSAWLMYHVAILIIAYGCMGISFMISTTIVLIYSLLNKRKIDSLNINIRELTLVNELCMNIGLLFMIIGIILGAIWANESWGNYWSWDPKETWALITAILYASVLHIRWFEIKENILRFNVLSQWAFLSIVMTYFGVNYIFNGMHSYGNTEGLSDVPMCVVVIFIMLFILPISGFLIRQQLKG